MCVTTVVTLPALCSLLSLTVWYHCVQVECDPHRIVSASPNAMWYGEGRRPVVCPCLLRVQWSTQTGWGLKLKGHETTRTWMSGTTDAQSRMLSPHASLPRGWPGPAVDGACCSFCAETGRARAGSAGGLGRRSTTKRRGRERAQGAERLAWCLFFHRWGGVEREQWCVDRWTAQRMVHASPPRLSQALAHATNVGSGVIWLAHLDVIAVEGDVLRDGFTEQQRGGHAASQRRHAFPERLHVRPHLCRACVPTHIPQ